MPRENESQSDSEEDVRPALSQAAPEALIPPYYPTQEALMVAYEIPEAAENEDDVVLATALSLSEIPETEGKEQKELPDVSTTELEMKRKIEEFMEMTHDQLLSRVMCLQQEALLKQEQRKLREDFEQEISAMYYNSLRQMHDGECKEASETTLLLMGVLLGADGCKIYIDALRCKLQGMPGIPDVIQALISCYLVPCAIDTKEDDVLIDGICCDKVIEGKACLETHAIVYDAETTKDVEIEVEIEVEREEAAVIHTHTQGSLYAALEQSVMTYNASRFPSEMPAVNSTNANPLLLTYLSSATMTTSTVATLTSTTSNAANAPLPTQETAEDRARKVRQSWGGK